MDNAIVSYIAAGVSVVSTLSGWFISVVSYKYKLLMLANEISSLKQNDIARLEAQLSEHIKQDIDERGRLRRSLRRVDRTLIRLCLQNEIDIPAEEEGG